MTVTVNAYEIAALVISLAFLALIIFLIPALIQIRRTIKEMEALSIESKKTVESLNHLLGKIEPHADGIEEVVKKVKDAGVKFAGMAEMIADSIKSPVISFISILLGVEEGIRRLLKRDKKGGEDDVNS